MVVLNLSKCLTYSVHQAAVPDILGSTRYDFFNKTINILKQTADIYYNRIKEINCLTSFNKPEGSMFVMVRELEDFAYLCAGKKKSKDWFELIVI